MKRLKVLVSAYACEPGVGSEPGIGWNWVRQIALRHDVWVITRRNNVARVEEECAREGLSIHVVGYDLPRWMSFWKKKSRGVMPYFYLWQLGIARIAARLHREVGFDVVHHLTFASSWVPSGLALIDRPFVWGPVGQHPRVPDRYLLKSDLRLRCAEWGKACVRRALLLCDPFLKRTLRAADRILSISGEFARRVPGPHRDKVQPFLACGVEPRELPEERFVRRGPLEVLYAGRLVDLKGVRLVLESFAHLLRDGVDARLVLCGTGPRGTWVERYVAAHSELDERVELCGFVPRDEVLRRMRESDVFLFPSFEGAGMVVAEAMGAGNPVVCMDFGGPGEMVGAERGLLVPADGDFDETSAALARALAKLAKDEDLRRELARNAYRWAMENATWEAKGERLAEIYALAREHRRDAS